MLGRDYWRRHPVELTKKRKKKEKITMFHSENSRSCRGRYFHHRAKCKTRNSDAIKVHQNTFWSSKSTVNLVD